jgi:NAD(P)H-dependent FMN reductase
MSAKSWERSIMHDQVNVALLYGSAHEDRFCDTITNWIASQIWERSDFVLDLIDPAAFDLSPRHGGAEGADVADLKRRIGKADAFIVVTPEYQRGYPAELKSVIDSVSHEWRGKPIAFVSYGGRSVGPRAVERLRLAFAELYAITIRDSVSFAHLRESFDADGAMPAPMAARKALATLLARLRWWALSLRNARNAVRYDRMGREPLPLRGCDFEACACALSPAAPATLPSFRSSRPMMA